MDPNRYQKIAKQSCRILGRQVDNEKNWSWRHFSRQWSAEIWKRSYSFTSLTRKSWQLKKVWPEDGPSGISSQQDKHLKTLTVRIMRVTHGCTCGFLKAVDLLEKGVKTDIANKRGQAAIHLATALDKVAVLQTMSKHRNKINIHQKGEHERTTLHIAAIYDHHECARILTINFDACLICTCINGLLKIHEAAKNVSSKTLEVLTQSGCRQGIFREDMVSRYDAKGNVPLYYPVRECNIKAVELCLKSGAKISATQYDLLTPVHLACSQGATKIINLMFKLQPEKKLTFLASQDAQKMTPLHYAAMFDHPELVVYLIAEGADINLVDKQNRSPLLLAASTRRWKIAHILIRLGSDVNVTDVNRRNILHLVVINGGRLKEFADGISKAKDQSSLLQLLNEKDIFGCCSMHYASREDHI